MHGKLLFGKIVAMPDSRWKLISICTLCGEGDVAQKLGELIDKISIHALREEGDALATDIEVEILNFYPRPPRGGRRRCDAAVESNRYFYPRPPRGGRRTETTAKDIKKWISIHALREEGDVHLFL